MTENPHLFDAFGIEDHTMDRLLIYRPKRGKFKLYELPEEEGSDLTKFVKEKKSDFKASLKNFVDTAVFEGSQLPSRVSGNNFKIQSKREEL